jgi:hypothetical protein
LERELENRKERVLNALANCSEPACAGEWGTAVPIEENRTVPRLVRGAAHHLDTEAERVSIIGAGLEPWIEDVRAHFIRMNLPVSGPTASAGHDASGGITSREQG